MFNFINLSDRIDSAKLLCRISFIMNDDFICVVDFIFRSYPVLYKFDHPRKTRSKDRNRKGFNKFTHKKNVAIKIEAESNVSKQGKSKRKRISESSSGNQPDEDDDFVKKPPIKLLKQNSFKKQISIGNTGKGKNSVRKLNTRFPPEHITNTMNFLNEKQKKCVESIGFGSALTMQLGKLTRRTCYWVVDNYNPTTNSLHIKDQRLVVTREIVHEIYGIPLGDIPMSNPFKANSENPILRLWKSQFPKKIKRIRPAHVIDMIRNDTEAGNFFIMNFLVLYVSVMIGSPTMGTVNQAFLENIQDDVDIKRLDWCGFVISCLKSSKLMWKRLDDTCVFTGPIGFLLLFYLHFTKVDEADKEISTPGLIHWTTTRLKDRQLRELSTRGIGNVIVSSEYKDINQSEKEDRESDDDDTVGFESDPIYSNGFSDEYKQNLESNYVLDETISIKKRYKTFQKRMNEHVEKYKQYMNFKDVELVFFPVLISHHYYLIVFDFRKATYVLIDNIKSEESIHDKYGNVPKDLKTLFNLYIASLNHPKTASMKRAKLIRMTMEWMTVRNYIDCGLFLMRHMETYKGEESGEWNVDLEPEFEDGHEQQQQLNELRKKYVTKILTSDLNVLKPSLYGNLPAYDRLSNEEKQSIDTEEHLIKIEARVSLFY